MHKNLCIFKRKRICVSYVEFIRADRGFEHVNADSWALMFLKNSANPAT